jgi:hypothetical protein
MAAVLAHLPNSGAAAQWSAVTRWTGALRLPVPQPRAEVSKSADQDVIDVEPRRVRVEDDPAGRAEFRDDAAPASSHKGATRAYREAMADLEAEMLREPFMYEKARGQNGLFLKSAPVKRGMLVDALA